MARLIDSSVFIALERRGEPLHALQAVLSDQPFALASISVSELLLGVHRADTDEQRSKRLEYVNEIIQGMSVLPFDLESAWTHARLEFQLAAIGRPIGPNDMIIAATALTHGYSVLTHNLRHFERVSGLTVEVPKL